MAAELRMNFGAHDELLKQHEHFSKLRNTWTQLDGEFQRVS
ncbi:hypothetical protein VCRA2133E348_1030006 [Vibrio crassostreae]|nr:hypothetical protein VCRA2133E348_1030006 [Vibrio crassostreae]CAK3109604.1 hypothetical protein VCRA213O314_1070003 [Vibrio crassostreae]